MRLRTKLGLLFSPFALGVVLVGLMAYLACGCAEVDRYPIDRAEVPRDVAEAAEKAKPDLDVSWVEKHVVSKTSVLDYTFYGQDASGDRWKVAVTPELAVVVSPIPVWQPMLEPARSKDGGLQP